MSIAVEQALLMQTRRAIRMLLAAPAARAQGLAEVRDLSVPAGAHQMRARLYRPVDASADTPLMLYFHGGGFVVCDIDTHDSICSWLAKSSGVQVVAVGYRLAPETAFPGQLDDVRAACSWGLAEAGAFGAAPERLLLAGDSAGAYLAALCGLELNTQRPGTVPLQTLLYPLVHLQDSLWADEELRNFRFLGRLAALYIAKSLGAETFPSLLDLDLSKSPDTIVAGGGPLDPVRADVKAYVGALRAAGVSVRERKYPILLHGGLNFTAISKTAKDVLSDVGGEIRALLAAQTESA
jgi:acetyl esterase